MKTDKNFKLNKETKRMMALFKFKDAHDRGAFKKSMVEAQATSEKVYKESQRKRDGSE
jgi:hypothetical protein